MGSVVGAFAVGAILLVLGLYLTFGPLVANLDVDVTSGETASFGLPGWFYFPVGIPTQVSWSEMTPPDFVEVRTCQSVTDGECVAPGPAIASGSGPTGSFTFTADEGQAYGINCTSGGVLTVQEQYTGAYGFLLFIVWMSGVVCIALGFLYNHQRGSRYAPI